MDQSVGSGERQWQGGGEHERTARQVAVTAMGGGREEKRHRAERSLSGAGRRRQEWRTSWRTSLEKGLGWVWDRLSFGGGCWVDCVFFYLSLFFQLGAALLVQVSGRLRWMGCRSGVGQSHSVRPFLSPSSLSSGIGSSA